MNLDVSLRALSVWQRNRDAFLRQWRSSAGGFLLEPFFILTAVGLGIGALVSGEEVESESYAHFVAPGILTAYAMFHASFECTFGAYMRMETYRIFVGIIVTPVSAEEVALGELLWGATRSGIGAVAILFVATLLGLVESPWAVLAIPMAALVGLMFASMALSLTAVAPAMSLLENYFTLFVTPLFFFGGVFFPVGELPKAVQVTSQVLPLTPAAHVIRDLFTGALGLDTLLHVGLVVAYIALFLPLALVLMRRRLIV